MNLIEGDFQHEPVEHARVTYARTFIKELGDVMLDRESFVSVLRSLADMVEEWYPPGWTVDYTSVMSVQRVQNGTIRLVYTVYEYGDPSQLWAQV